MSGRFFLISPFMSWFFLIRRCILKAEEKVKAMDMKKIGAFLKALRKEKGLTQEQAGEIFMVTGRTVSRWETGVNMPDLGLLVQIAEFYDVDLNEIFSGERRNEDMDKKLKDTLLKAADYSKLEKEKKAKAGNAAFMLMFSACVIAIVIQMALTADLGRAAGETAAVIIGGIVYLALILYNGLWERRTEKKLWLTDLVVSILCGGFFSVLYGCCILKMGAERIEAVRLGTGFFVGITIVGFLVLRGLACINKKQRDKGKKVEL